MTMAMSMTMAMIINPNQVCRIRGFTYEEAEVREMYFDEPGEHVVDYCAGAGGEEGGIRPITGNHIAIAACMHPPKH